MADDDVDEIERAASNRSRCKGCGVAIDKDELRFCAANLEIPILPRTFYHLRCARDAMPERFAAVAATMGLPDEAIPPAPSGALSQLMSIERAPSARARCQQCKAAIASGALRVIVRVELPPDEAAALAAEGYPTYRQGFIHLGCAPALTNHADGLDAYLAKRATKKDVDAVTSYARARKLLADQPELVAAGEPSVVGDWLEAKHAIVIPTPDLMQLLGVKPPKQRAAKTKKATKAAPKSRPAATKATATPTRRPSRKGKR